MRKFILVVTCSVGLALAAPASAWASQHGTNGPSQNPTTGQHGAPANTCGSPGTSTPGNAVNAHGSPFNPSGQAGLVYAGNPNTASAAQANSSAAVAQYDVACF
jgi:hypothetical protein